MPRRPQVPRRMSLTQQLYTAHKTSINLTSPLLRGPSGPSSDGQHCKFAICKLHAPGTMSSWVHYRVIQKITDFGWVDLDLGSSLGWWAATYYGYPLPKQDDETIQILVNPTCWITPYWSEVILQQCNEFVFLLVYFENMLLIPTFQLIFVEFHIIFRRWHHRD